MDLVSKRLCRDRLRFKINQEPSREIALLVIYEVYIFKQVGIEDTWLASTVRNVELGVDEVRRQESIPVSSLRSLKSGTN